MWTTGRAELVNLYRNIWHIYFRVCEAFTMTTAQSTDTQRQDLFFRSHSGPDRKALRVSADLDYRSYLHGSQSSIKAENSPLMLPTFNASKASSTVLDVDDITVGNCTLATFDTFHKFPKLPKELRLTIWEFAAAAVGPRTIAILEEKIHRRGSLFSIVAKVPAILITCKESREIGLKVYDLVNLEGFGRQRCIYINWEADTLIFPASELLIGFFSLVEDSKNPDYAIASGYSLIREHLKSVVFRAELYHRLFYVKYTLLHCANLENVRVCADDSIPHENCEEFIEIANEWFMNENPTVRVPTIEFIKDEDMKQMMKIFVSKPHHSSNNQNNSLSSFEQGK